MMAHFAAQLLGSDLPRAILTFGYIDSLLLKTCVRKPFRLAISGTHMWLCQLKRRLQCDYTVAIKGIP
jgi:hypothetical protein